MDSDGHIKRTQVQGNDIRLPLPKNNKMQDLGLFPHGTMSNALAINSAGRNLFLLEPQ